MNARVTLAEIVSATEKAKSVVAARASRECWPYTEESVRGGKRRLYAPADLPRDVQKALTSRAARSLSVDVVSSAGSSLPAISIGAGAPVVRAAPVFSCADLTDRQRLERDARKGVLAAMQRLQLDADCSQEAAINTLLINARTGRLEAHLEQMLRLARDPRGRAGDGFPSARTLKRWLAAGDLAPKMRQADMVVPSWGKAFLQFYQRPEKPSVENAYRAACNQAWTAGERPSIHQVRRFLAKLGTVTREAGRMGPRELKNIRPFVRRTFDLLEPNDVWTADGHTFDAEVQHPMHGRPFRPEITMFIDVATRRAVGWSVDLAESTIAVADALRYSVERNGIPALCYFDNGSGFKNRTLSSEATGLLARIGSEPTYSLPYNSQARGVIERAHQTVWVDGAKTLPGFIGAAMDREARLEQFKLSRRALKGGVMPLMPWHLFVEWCEQRVAWYNARAHRSLKGLSPDLSWANFQAKGWAPELLGADEIDTLFRPRVSRTLARAEIRLFNNIYFARELEEFHGAEVHIAYDIHSAERVWVYLPDGRLLCEAQVNGNAKHYFPVPVIEQARQKRAQGRLARVEVKREEILAELNGSAALPAAEAGQMIIAGRIVDPAAALAARRDAADAIDVSPQPSADGCHAIEPDIKPRSRSERSAAENYADWLALDERITSGEEIDDADARWHRTYQTSAQFKAHTKKTATRAATQVA